MRADRIRLHKAQRLLENCDEIWRQRTDRTAADTTMSTSNLSLRITAESSAAVERVWQIREDPRQLERWLIMAATHR